MQPHILIAAGDYDIVYALQEALRSTGVHLKYSYSHRDTFYMLQQGRQVRLVIVDAAMFDRYTGEFTVYALLNTMQDLVLVGVGLEETSRDRAKHILVHVLTSLDEDHIHEVLSSALGTSLVRYEQRGGRRGARTEEMYTLFEVSRTLTEVLDLTEVLNRVVEAARRLTHAEEGMILLPDERNPSQLILRARVGIDIETARNFRIKVDDSLAGEVYRSGRPTVVKSLNQVKIKTEYFAHSVLYVPILLKERPIGVLGVNNRVKHDPFDIHQQQLLMNLASYAAIAIQNARIHEESLQRTRDLELLVRVSKVISGSLAMHQTLVTTAEQLKQMVGVNRAEIYQWGEAQNVLLWRAIAFRALWAFPRRQVSLPLEVRSAFYGGQPAWTVEEGRCLCWVALSSGDRLLGVLRLVFADETPKLFEPSAINRGRFAALEALHTFINRSQARDSTTVLRLLETVNQTFSSAWCELLIDHQGALTVVAELGTASWIDPPLTPRAVFSRAAPTDAQIVLDAVDQCSALLMPLIIRGIPWGLIVLSDTDEARTFSQREIDLLQALAAQSATALDNAQLFLELQKSLQSLSQAQDRLVQAARLSAMGELAAVVAHQINNPLTTIIVDTELMLMDEPPDSRNYKPLQAIERAGRRAAGVARRLLSIARPNDPDTPPEYVDVLDTLRGILSLVGTYIERRSITIETAFPERELPPVLAVRGQLDDIWLNLLMNAHDALATCANARIHVSVDYQQEYETIVVCVRDNGPGIPEHLREQIFDPFFTTKPVGEGTGLGLHICRQVVNQVRGAISVESGVGQGTVFIVRLPTIYK